MRYHTSTWAPLGSHCLNCSRLDTWLNVSHSIPIMCHSIPYVSKNIQFRLSRNSTKFDVVARFRETIPIVKCFVIRDLEKFRTFTEIIILSFLRKLEFSGVLHDALVLTLEIGKHLMKRILVDPSSAGDLLYLPALLRLGYKPDYLCNPRRVLVSFNRSQTKSLGEIGLPISTRPIIALVLLIVIDDTSSFNAILGRTWIHAMKALLSSYH